MVAVMRPEGLIGKRSTDREVADLFADDAPPLIDYFAEMTMLEYSARGMAIYLDTDDRVVTVFLYGTRDEGHNQYGGPLPRGLSFTDDEATVARSLGTPSRRGIHEVSKAPWERFDSEEVSLHIEYAPDGRSIQMITLMSVAIALGKV
jgi:hypothetical protein